MMIGKTNAKMAIAGDYSVTINGNAGGSIEPSIGVHRVNHGDNFDITITPSFSGMDGHYIKKVTDTYRKSDGTIAVDDITPTSTSEQASTVSLVSIITNHVIDITFGDIYYIFKDGVVRDGITISTATRSGGSGSYAIVGNNIVMSSHGSSSSSGQYWLYTPINLINYSKIAVDFVSATGDTTIFNCINFSSGSYEAGVVISPSSLPTTSSFSVAEYSTTKNITVLRAHTLNTNTYQTVFNNWRLYT